VPDVFCGVDVGAATTKVVLLDRDATVLGSAVRRTGVDLAGRAGQALDAALADAGLTREALTRTVATGFGRDEVPFADATATEIRCHARGAYHHVPEQITVVDIGGEDNKIIRLDAQGHQRNFRMNRKCAAGTGAFIEETAGRMDVALADLDALGRQATAPVKLSSFCTVFAKTELLRRTREGATLPDLVRGTLDAVVGRVAEMGQLDGTVVMTGGVVAHVPLVAEILSERIGREVRVPPSPQLIGALGAALIARTYRKEE